MQVLAVPREIYVWLKNQGIDITKSKTGFDLQDFPQDVQELLKEHVPFTLPDSEDDDSFYPGDDCFNYYTGANVVHDLSGIPLTESGHLNPEQM